jgi:hypothetical protein
VVAAVVGREDAEQKFTAHAGVALIIETSDCGPVPHALLMGCFKNCTRTSIFICIILTAIIFASSSHAPALDTKLFSAILRLD